MSCCCNNSYSGLPCCCPANYSTTTTTTCPFGICCDPSCNNGEICEEVYSSDCAIYSGPEIVSECFTIQSGMNLTEILETVMGTICTTTTTTVPPSGPFRCENTTIDGSITFIGTILPTTVLPTTITSGSFPIDSGETLVGTHQGIDGSSNFDFSTNGVASTISVYINDILVNCITLSPGDTSVQFPPGATVLPTDDLKFVYSNNPC